MLYGHLVPTWTFELPKLTTVFYLDIYSAIWTFELPIRMIGSNQWILDLENLYKENQIQIQIYVHNSLKKQTQLHKNTSNIACK